MKKFFSLLCATLLVFSASAAPVAKKAELVKKAPVAVEQMQSVQFEKAQTLNLNQLSATPALKVSNQKASVARRNSKSLKANLQQPSAQPAVHKAPAAVQEVIEVTDGELYQEPDYIQIWSETQQLYFIYYLNDGAFELNTTYSLTDMYMACAMTEDYDQDDATACSITITKPEGLLNIVASMTTESGKEYAITYAETPFVPSGNKVNVNGTNLKGQYNSYYGMYVYTADCGNGLSIQLTFDVTEEEATYTNEDLLPDYCVYYSSDYETYVEFKKLATDITITTTETTKTLTGSIYATDGDEYVLNLVYEKPDAKYIDINVDHATLTNKTVAGFWTIGGQTEDKIYDCNIYFISKGLQGTWTDVTKFDAYSTWVSDKSSGSNVYYENLSEVNLTSAVVEDSLVVEGTLSLADYNGNPAIVTVHISTPFTQEWGEWEDYAPFDFNTGKYTFTAATSGTQTNIPVQVRKDNTGYKQFKFVGWSKQILTANGIDLIVDMAPDYTCTVAEQNTGAYQSAYSEYIMVSDLATYSGQDFPSTYDPETGTFELAMIYYISLGNFGYDYETMVMDKPNTERDTVDIVSTKLQYNDGYLASNNVVIFYAADVPDYYLFRVTSNNATSVDGTFKWADGGINNPNSYFSVTGSDKNYFQDGEFTVVTNNKDIALTGWMIGTDEKYYRLDMSYTAPTTRDTVRFSGKGVTISECVNSQTGVQTGWFYQLADASTGYEFLLQSTVVAEKYGTFSYADKTLGSNYYNVFNPQGNRQQFVEGSITVGEVGDEIVLDGELIAEDEKVYVLHFTQSTSILNYDTDAPFEATFAWSNMEASLDNGVIGIYATNAENLTIGLELYADPAATTIPAGTYVISDTQEAGTALKSLGVAGGYLTECWAGVRGTSGITDCWFIVDGTVTLSYDEFNKLKVVVDGTNSYGQPVKAVIAYEKIEPKAIVTIDDAEFFAEDAYVPQYGIMNFYGGNADGFDFDLYVYSEDIAGDFINDVDFGDCELTLADGSHVGVIDATEFKVVADGKNLTLTAKVLGTDTVQYNINAIGYLGYIGGDAKEAYRGEFAIEDVTFLQATKTQVMFNALNAAGDSIAIVVTATLNDEGLLDAGEYSEVMASTGWTLYNEVTPSFVSNETASWFIQSGKLTVAEDGSMVFEGLNSYDAPVVVKIGDVPAPPVTDYYLVGWINNAAYGIEGDIDNFGDYHFVDGKVKATFNELSYVQVKDNNKQIYGTAAYVAPVEKGNATLVANGWEKIGINGGDEYEYTLVVNEDGTLEIFYEKVTETGLHNTKANVKAAKQIKNGQIVIVRENKEYNILGTAL